MTQEQMRAKQLYETGRFEEAAQLCRAILSRNAQDSEANHLLGLIFYRQGQNRMAVDFLQRARSGWTSSIPSRWRQWEWATPGS